MNEEVIQKGASMDLQKAPTLKDIADRLGVSQMTVSRAYRNHPNVSAEMRKRIMAAVTEMGYSPNESAKELAERKGSASDSCSRRKRIRGGAGA